MKHAAAVSVCLLAFSPALADATIVYMDGLSHVIDSEMVEADGLLLASIQVLDGPGGSVTSVEVVSGGRILNLSVAESSRATMTAGGIVGAVLAQHDAEVSLIGGFAQNNLFTYDNASLSLSGVHMQGGLWADGASFVQVSSVSMDLGVNALGSSVVSMGGGSVGYLVSRDTALIELSGGTVRSSVSAYESSFLDISGGSIAFALDAFDTSVIHLSGGSVGTSIQAVGLDAVINIFGTDFAVDGQPVPFGRLDTMTGTLTGLLRSGDLISSPFFSHGAPCGNGECFGTINLVPEPSTAALLAAGLVGLAMTRRRSSSPSGLQ